MNCIALIGSAALLLMATTSRADINGFGDFSNFTVNQSDGNAGPTIAPGTIHLTNNAANDVRSIFDNTRQTITQFTASFTFRAIGSPNNTSEFGACFVVQNDHVNTVATNNEGIQGTFGLQDWQGVFGNSVAISLEYGSLASNSSATAMYKNGSVGGGAGNTSPLNLYSGDPINVTITYNGTSLHENLVDTVTAASYDNFYLVNIPSTIGTSTAFIGFTANTANTSGAADISNFQFASSVPEPASISLLAIAGLTLITRRRRASK